MKNRPRRFTGILRACPLLLTLVFAMGMGQAPGVSRTPADSPFDANITDASRTKVHLASVTFDGDTTLGVTLGKGRVQIPLENISRIEVKDGDLCVTFKDAKTMCGLKAGGSTRVSGKTDYGTYKILLKDVSSIDIVRKDSR
ncbi:MAG TPA: hypothetical protein PLS81_01715 [Deltaproteobacteria bacterium]|nr:hypothetical protein [Deltaproteobacteria bacterium]HOM28159.1 hypothetical protein [Deltaproteobacteria bacterium]HPP79299.1 hypothetical protein [Deltaproteobacteria bacterium]